MMGYAKIQHIVEKYANMLTAHIPERDSVCTLCHVKWMLTEMKEYTPDRSSDKLNRWLGFVQGVFWCEDVYTIDEMRTHNMSGEVE